MASLFTGQRVYRNEAPNYGPATIVGLFGENAEIAYDEGGSGWWPAHALLVNDPSLPPPDWSRFKGELLTTPEINAALAAALPQAPGAVMTLPAALIRAGDGDWTDFVVAWSFLQQQTLIPASVLATVVALAGDCYLPPQFAEALTPADLP